VYNKQTEDERVGYPVCIVCSYWLCVIRSYIGNYASWLVW